MRRPLSPTRRAELFRDREGRCHLCQGRIGVGEAWEVEHATALSMGGADEPDNWFLAHVKCHRAKTNDDLGHLAKAKRRERKHLGARKPSRFPGSRDSKLRKKVDGTVVLR